MAHFKLSILNFINAEKNLEEALSNICYTPLVISEFYSNIDNTDEAAHKYSYCYTYDENVSFHQNCQKELTFSLNQYVIKDGEKQLNPFFNLMKVGCQLLLEDQYDNQYLFTIKNISYDFNKIINEDINESKSNIILKIECQDSFSYQANKQNNGYEIENDPDDEDYIGAKNIDYWADLITTDSHFSNYKYVKIGEALDNVKTAIVASDDDDDGDYDIFLSSFVFSGSGSVGSLLQSLGNQIGLVLQTYEKFDESTNICKCYFFYVPQYNENLTGIKYSPYSEVQNFSTSIQGDGLTTVMNVSGPTYNDEIVELLPDIPDKILDLFITNTWQSKNFINYPEKTFSDFIKTIKHDSTISGQKIYDSGESFFTFSPIHSSVNDNQNLYYINTLQPYKLYTCDFMYQVDFSNVGFGNNGNTIYISGDGDNNQLSNTKLFVLLGNTLQYVFNYSRTTSTGITIYSNQNGIVYNFDDSYSNYTYYIGQDVYSVNDNWNIFDSIKQVSYTTNSINFTDDLYKHLYLNYGLYVTDINDIPIAYIKNNSITYLEHYIQLDVANYNIYCGNRVPWLYTTDTSVTSVYYTGEISADYLNFANIVDKIPWLENKIIDFTYYKNWGLLSDSQYKDLYDRIYNDLRRVNGKLLYYTKAYYLGLKNKVNIISEMQNQFDTLGASLYNDLLNYSNGTKTDFSLFNSAYNSIEWTASKDEKIGIINYNKTMALYINKYFNALQRFLKNIQLFRESFNSQVGFATIYNNTITLSDSNYYFQDNGVPTNYIKLTDEDAFDSNQTYYDGSYTSIGKIVTADNYQQYYTKNKTAVSASGSYNSSLTYYDDNNNKLDIIDIKKNAVKNLGSTTYYLFDSFNNDDNLDSKLITINHNNSKVKYNYIDTYKMVLYESGYNNITDLINGNKTSVEAMDDSTFKQYDTIVDEYCNTINSVYEIDKNDSSDDTYSIKQINYDMNTLIDFDARFFNKLILVKKEDDVYSRYSHGIKVVLDQSISSWKGYLGYLILKDKKDIVVQYNETAINYNVSKIKSKVLYKPNNNTTQNYCIVANKLTLSYLTTVNLNNIVYLLPWTISSPVQNINYSKYEQTTVSIKNLTSLSNSSVVAYKNTETSSLVNGQTYTLDTYYIPIDVVSGLYNAISSSWTTTNIYDYDQLYDSGYNKVDLLTTANATNGLYYIKEPLEAATSYNSSLTYYTADEEIRHTLSWFNNNKTSLYVKNSNYSTYSFLSLDNTWEQQFYVHNKTTGDIKKYTFNSDESGDISYTISQTPIEVSLNKGNFWWLYKDDESNPILQEQAAVIDSELSGYWNLAYTASNYCDYFIPESWHPQYDNGDNNTLFYKFFIENTNNNTISLNEDLFPTISSFTTNLGFTFAYDTYNDVNNMSSMANWNIINSIFKEKLFNNENNSHIQLVTYDGQVDTREIYYSTYGGILQKDVVNLLTNNSDNYDKYSGLYTMYVNWIYNRFTDKIYNEYNEALAEHNSIWTDIYHLYPYMILESNYSNDDATSSEELYNKALAYFKDSYYPEVTYDLTTITNINQARGYYGQEIKIGDGIELDVNDLYSGDSADYAYKVLSTPLFVTDISYDLRSNSDMKLTVTKVKYQDKVSKILAKVLWGNK